jgi:Fe-S cluster biogenesis protein NfuA
MTTEELTIEVQNSKKLDLLNSDGGDITLISIEDDKHVKCEGACTSCSVNQMTLRAGVETTIKNLLTNRNC